MKEYCTTCRLALREWEWCGDGRCEACTEKADMIVQTLRRKLTAEVAKGVSVHAIAKAIGRSQPQVRAFHRSESQGSAGMLEALAKRYRMTLKAAK